MGGADKGFRVVVVVEDGFAELGDGEEGPGKMMVFMLPSMWRGALIFTRMGASCTEEEEEEESRSLKSSYSSGWSSWAAGWEDGTVRKYGGGGEA